MVRTITGVVDEDHSWTIRGLELNKLFYMRTNNFLKRKKL